MTWRLKEIRLKSALNLILDELDLTYILRDEVLMITTREKAEAAQEIKVYSVRDVVLPAEAVASGDLADFDSLVEMITSTIAPASWDEVGGPDTIEAYSPNYTLVCSQTRDVHQQIADLIAELRAKAEPVRSPKEAAILRSLEEVTSIEFVETPLSDVVDYVKELHKIDIQIDKKGLHEAGVNPDTPISWHLRGITLRSALNMILGEFDLAYAVTNDVLMITTKEDKQAWARGETFLKVYRVPAAHEAAPTAEGEAPKAPASSPPRDIEERLAKAIQETVAPESWKENGAAIRAVPGALFVRQTADVHSQIRKALNAFAGQNPDVFIPFVSSPMPVVGRTDTDK